MKRPMMNSVGPAFCVAAALAALSARGETAGEILRATGVEGGLVVHVGCGDGRLTAALHANDSYMVSSPEQCSS